MNNIMSVDNNKHELTTTQSLLSSIKHSKKISYTVFRMLLLKKLIILKYYCEFLITISVCLLLIKYTN